MMTYSNQVLNMLERVRNDLNKENVSEIGVLKSNSLSERMINPIKKNDISFGAEFADPERMKIAIADRGKAGIKDAIIDNATSQPLPVDTVPLHINSFKSIEEFMEYAKQSNNNENINKFVKQGTIDGNIQNEILTEPISNAEIKNFTESLIHNEYIPSTLEQGLQIAMIGALVDGVFMFSGTVLSKMSEGKRLDDFTQEDWASIFEQTGLGVVRGGVVGGGIYALTNATGLNSFVAAALITATYGIVVSTIHLAKGEITLEQYIQSVNDTAINSAISGAGAISGQALIPVPIVGAVIGSIIAQYIYKILLSKLSKEDCESLGVNSSFQNCGKLAEMCSKHIIEITNDYNDDEDEEEGEDESNDEVSKVLC